MTLIPDGPVWGEQVNEAAILRVDVIPIRKDIANCLPLGGGVR